MNYLINLSENLQKSIFEYNIDEFNKQVIELINFLTQELEERVVLKKQDEMSIIKTIIDNINFAFCNKDYLLFADILKYELESNF
ncbi:hypothetical protein [Clostridium beijerinckii]|uniref:hypothetical protein n=1 Tax=Clostridium beijerinckii TaxID=1520 RepID=UPI0003124263|nr:hypothetical protein [Clostridium beijerinckii]